MRSAYKIVLLTALTIAPLDQVLSHHSPAQYDQSQVIEQDATVISFEFRNPHSYIHVRDAENSEWMLETSSAVRLSRNGWNKDLFSPGDQISFRANANSNPEKNRLYLNSVTDSTGETFDLNERGGGPPDAGSPASTTSLEGIWEVDAPTLFRMPDPTENHPLTAKGQQARAEYDETMDPVADCIAWPTPYMVVVSFIYPMKIELADDEVVFRHEFYNTTRTIYMDGREHPLDIERTNQGHSIGHWDDGTLVIDTRLFADHRSPMLDGVPSGAQRHVVERYSLSEDGTGMTVNVLLEDPEYLAEPMNLEIPLLYAPGEKLQDFDCDIEIARRYTE